MPGHTVEVESTDQGFHYSLYIISHILISTNLFYVTGKERALQAEVAVSTRSEKFIGNNIQRHTVSKEV